MSLAEEINKLPPDLQQQVADFVGYLHEKNKRKPQVDAQRQWRELAGIAAFPLKADQPVPQPASTEKPDLASLAGSWQGTCEREEQGEYEQRLEL